MGQNAKQPGLKLKSKVSVVYKKECIFETSGNHVIAVTRGSEDYDSLQLALKSVSASVHQLQTDKEISIEGKPVPIEVYLGGDYKVSILHKNNIQ